MNTSSHISSFIFFLLFTNLYCITTACNKKDLETLLLFKNGVDDIEGTLSSWKVEEDCCSWEGVYCNNLTKRIGRLDLSNILKGELNLNILLRIEFLTHLDISWNLFDSVIFPSPHNYTFNSKIQYLDISNSISVMDNLNWISNLSSLQYVSLDSDLHKVTNWLQPLAVLPNLRELDLAFCNLNTLDIPSLYKLLNSSHFRTLDLTHNNITSKFPFSRSNFSSDISHIGLFYNPIYGKIPESFFKNFRNLIFLDIGETELEGPIPSSLGELEHLESFVLAENLLKDSNESILSNLSTLVELFIDYDGKVSEKAFSKLYNLKFLGFANSMVRFDHEWIPPFDLDELSCYITNLGPTFPQWLYTQKSLKSFQATDWRFSLIDENKFWSFVGGISWLHLANCSLSGQIGDRIFYNKNLALDKNNLTGKLPEISQAIQGIDLSNNHFSGSIPSSWVNLTNLYRINLQNNQISGEILINLSKSKKLTIMNLENNKFSGFIAKNMSQQLEVLILRGNRFEGKIPQEVFNLSRLFHLDLAENQLSGSIPACLENMFSMTIPNIVSSGYLAEFDLHIKGQIYGYLSNGERHTIDFSANNLSGKIPRGLFELIQVQSLNLSFNEFNGKIPDNIGKMVFLESLDLSSNRISGEIPEKIGSLTFLGYLNLSNNDLFGKIPLSTQIQSFNASSFEGNPKLCGAPLQKCATENKTPKIFTPSGSGSGSGSKKPLYIVCGIIASMPFVVLFVCFCIRR